MRTQTKIKLSIYSCELTVVVTDAVLKEANKIYRQNNIEETIEGECEGLVITPQLDKHYLLLDLESLSHNTIAHEVYHAVGRITEDRAVKEEEARAWLAGHISGSIYKFLNRKKLKVKHG